MREIITLFEGNLTGTIYSHSQNQDEALYHQIEPALRPKSGPIVECRCRQGCGQPGHESRRAYPATVTLALLR